MKNRILSLISFLIFILLIQNAYAMGFRKVKSNNVNLGDRSYNIYVPENISGKKMPLLLALHGGFGNARSFERVININYVADRYGFIVVYPNGTEGTSKFMRNKRMWNSGNCCGVASKTNVDDVGFLARIIGDVVSKYNVDADRVYITGHSNGAMMSYRFACERPDLVAAAVIIAGQLTANKCDRPGNVKILHIHGTSDRIVPLQGGVVKNSRTGVDYRSIAETAQELSNKGASFSFKELRGAGHGIRDINKTLMNDSSITLAEMIIKYLKDKHKNKMNNY